MKALQLVRSMIGVTKVLKPPEALINISCAVSLIVLFRTFPAKRSLAITPL
jgi:hypothetical protein